MKPIIIATIAVVVTLLFMVGIYVSRSINVVQTVVPLVTATTTSNLEASSEDVAYANEMATVLTTYSNLSTFISEQINAGITDITLMADTDWNENTLRAVTWMKTNNVVMRGLVAPPLFETIQADLVVAANHLDLAMSLIEEGIEEFDTSVNANNLSTPMEKLLGAGSEMSAAQDVLEQVNTKISAMLSAFTQEMPTAIVQSTPKVFVPNIDETAYADQLTMLMTSYGEGVESLTAHIKEPTGDIFVAREEEWLKSADEIIVKMRATNDAIKNLVAPPLFVAVQADIIVAAYHSSRGLTLLEDAIDDINDEESLAGISAAPEKLYAAAAAMSKAQNFMRQASAKVSALADDL